MLRTSWKLLWQGHVIELENRRFLERLLVDGKEVARQEGVTFQPRSFEATIPQGDRIVSLQASTRPSRQPRGLRCTMSVDGKEIYSDVRWPLRWSLAIGAGALGLVCLAAAAILSRFGH